MSEIQESTVKTVKKAVGIIMVATLLSRLLGWVKLTSLTALYGRGLETDTFLGASAIPDLLYLLVSGGAMTAAFIPLFTEYISTGRKEEGWRFASTVWNQIAVFLIVFICIGEIFTSKIVLLMPGFRKNPEAIAYAITFVRILYPMVIFTALAAMCNGVLHSFNHFTAPAASWLIYNVCFIAAAYVSYNNLGLRGICIGVVAGAMLMVAVQVPMMMKNGLRYYPRVNWRDPAAAKYWKLFLPVMLGMSLTQINLMIMPTVFGSMVGTGAITALSYANRIMFIPIGMFGSAISMAIFPTLSQLAVKGDREQIEYVLTRGIRATFMFSLPCTAYLLVAGLPSIRIVLGYGKFTYVHCVATAHALTYFAIGLVGHSAIQAVNRGFYARKNTITPVLTGAIGLFTTIPLSLLLIRTPLKHGGVALAISIATLINMGLLLFLARKALGIRIRKIAPMFLKTAFASLLMGITGLLVGRMFNLGPHRFGFTLVLADLAAITCSSLLVFVAVVKLLRVEEFDEMLGMVLNKFRPRKA